MSVDTGAADFDGGLNLDAQIGEPQDTGNQQPSGGNPAWNDALNSVPAEFRNGLTGHFQKWDQNFRQQVDAAKQEAIKPYAGYQQFIDNRMNPDDLAAGYRILHGINTRPLEIYNQLTEMLRQNGMLPAEVQQQQQPEELVEDPRITEMQRQQQEFIQNWQNQQIEAQREAAFNQKAVELEQGINAEFDRLGQAIGNVPDWLRLELLNRASSLTDAQHRPVGILEAFQDWQRVQAQVMQARQPAARIVPSGGGFPGATPNPDALKTADGRMAAGEEIARRFRQQ
jgi:hypothetical protein